MKRLLSIILSLVINTTLYAQSDSCILIIQTDPIDSASFSEIQINVIQKGTLIRTRFNAETIIKKGISLDIEFEGKSTTMPGYRRLKIYSDTAIIASSKILPVVIINSKRRIVKQTLKGFEYNPSNDSLFRNQPIFNALQRLPFIQIINESIEYKQGQKILYKINGRERKGIGNNWNQVLKAIKANNIYKVELLTEIPTYVRDRGYSAILNVLTKDANLYGKTISLATIYDQRENLNSNAGITFQRKRSDYSFKVSNSNDKQVGSKTTQVYDNTNLAIDNKLNSRYTYSSINAYLDYGLRIDSAKDFGLNFEFQKNKNKTQLNNYYSLPSQLPDQINTNERYNGTLNLSYVHRKTDLITKSISASLFAENHDFHNAQTFLSKKKHDSLSNKINSISTYWILEYNYINTEHETYNIEYGIQFYNKQLKQDYSRFMYDTTGNHLPLEFYFANDSLNLVQYSVRPYLKYDKLLSNTKSIVLDINSELYSMKNLKQSYFYLPTIKLRYKKLFKNNTSAEYSLNYLFQKPSIEYFSPVIVNIDPLENQVGSPDLIPSKTISSSLEFIKVKKATSSHKLFTWYGYDNINFFTKYDSIKNALLTSSNNGGKTYGLGYNASYQRLIGKKLNVSLEADIAYSKRWNKVFNTSNNGVIFSLRNNFTYTLGGKYGNMGLISFINGNQITNQGYYRGTFNYSFYYSKSFFKGRFVTTFSASQFLLKSRNVKTYTFSDNSHRYTSDVRPYRLLSIRFGYNFSDIKVSKFATKKSPQIRGEMIK